MALKPTIYKFRVNLADTNRNQYSDINLTVAKHPSENQVRMMVRLLAFCLNSTEHLTFTKGLSDQDEPDIWELSDIGDILTWIDVGEPSSDRIKKATRKSKHTHIYTFNENKSDVWFGKNQAALRQLNVSITQLDFAPIEALTHALQRTNDLSLMISGHSLFVTLGEVNEEVTLTELQTQE
ncbi:YaeQ family protein [Vibrio rarus]|uniref:YaeQ family protein n=1 Tax=Vibrio rarus TaxID=413403 RepID=UPI0021C35C76|nr:YaeQ family protein [Vibrio rarus]